MFKSENTASDEIVVFLTENGSAAGARYPTFVFLSFPFLCVLLIARADCSPRWGHMCAQKHAMVPLLRKPWFAKKKGKAG